MKYRISITFFCALIVIPVVGFHSVELSKAEKAVLKRAIEFCVKNKMSEAIDLYRSVSMKVPHALVAYAAGKCYVSTGSNDKARAAFLEALESPYREIIYPAYDQLHALEKKEKTTMSQRVRMFLALRYFCAYVPLIIFQVFFLLMLIFWFLVGHDYRSVRWIMLGVFLLHLAIMRLYAYNEVCRLVCIKEGIPLVLRAGPDNDFHVVLEMIPEERYLIVKRSTARDEWLYVKHGKKRGWLSRGDIVVWPPQR
ncbi:MAG: hypothetical protein WBQ73_01840 [Candidatus Babeliales bacterium]